MKRFHNVQPGRGVIAKECKYEVFSRLARPVELPQWRLQLLKLSVFWAPTFLFRRAVLLIHRHQYVPS